MSPFDPSKFSEPLGAVLGMEHANTIIQAKYDQMGGPNGFLGPATAQPGGIPGPGPAGLQVTDDGKAFFRDFQNGSIYLAMDAPEAFEIHGAIFQKWDSLGRNHFGLPVTDETATQDGVGAFSHFDTGSSIYWTPGTGPHEVHGAIRDRWSALGWETSALGYPVTDESDNPDNPATGRGARFSAFQNGFISWSPQTGAREHINGRQYTFSLDSMQVGVTRSGNIFGNAKDTDVASLQIKVGGNTIGPVTKGLGDFGDGGPYNIGLSLQAAADDPAAPVSISFAIVNNADGDTAALRDQIKKYLDQIGEAGAAAIGTAVGAAIGGAIGSLGGPIGAALGAIIGAGAEALISVLFQNCDGPVVIDTIHVSGATLNDFTAPRFSNNKNYPGVKSPAGCGANSSYNVIYSIGQ